MIKEEIKIDKDIRFKIGDVVQCLTGGPEMTIRSQQVGNMAKCFWFDLDDKMVWHYQEVKLPADILRKVVK